MVILSQDKTQIINFDETFRLYVDSWSDEEFPTEQTCFCIRAGNFNEHKINAFLGEYSTMERAKEVLKEILIYNSKFNLFKCVCAGVQKAAGKFQKENMTFDLYEMPEE